MGMRLAILTLAVLLVSCGPSADKSVAGSDDLKTYLPAEKELGLWKARGVPQEFRGDDLYIYMDGGAAIYREYGFRQLLVQDYADPYGRSLTLEVFEMDEPDAAFGIYTFKVGSQGKWVDLGQEGSLEDYYLNFWEGRYLITLTGFDREVETTQRLLRVGQLVDSRINGPAAPPALVGLLPGRDLIGSSVKYFRGPLGLFQSYPFTTTDAFGIRAGVKGDYSAGYSFYVIEYETPERLLERFAAVAKSLQEDPKFKNFRMAAKNTAFLEDRQGRCLGLRAVGRWILIVLGPISAESAASLLDDYETDEE